MIKILDEIYSPEDIKRQSFAQLKILAGEIREFLIEKVSETGGHLASNLGVVELTLALHKVFNTPADKIIWDVGHQTYVHKIITGRKDKFSGLRKLGGISGFPKICESEHDCFNTGHSSTSISAALGMARARDVKGEKYSVVAVIGDGALTGGMAFEALNDAGGTPDNFIVVLNDNEMSISRNVGGLSSYLSKIRTQPIYFKVKEDIDLILNKIPGIGKSAVRALSRVKGSIKYMLMPGVIFEELGFKYLGPIDGHNINELVSVFNRARCIKGPVFIHVCTQKGKGYGFAEKDPQQFHGVSPFEIETGEVLGNKGAGYSAEFGNHLVKLAGENDRIIAVTAAMPNGTGLDIFAEKFSNRFFDVGIAEQHAVTFCSGLAANGLTPVFAVYSSFLQRAYDQIMHDVALQKLHVILAIDRAGIVGEDGETHQGLYDLSYLCHVPGMTIMTPSDYCELKMMLEYAVNDFSGPVAIRYPRGRGVERLTEPVPISLGKGVRLSEGNDVTIIAIGAMVEVSLIIKDHLTYMGLSVELINARFAKPIDEELITESAKKTKRLITIEDGTIIGGFGSLVSNLLIKNNIHIKTKLIGFPDKFIEHGSRKDLLDKYGLDYETLIGEIYNWTSEK